MSTPTALTAAKTIAEDAAGRSVRYRDMVIVRGLNEYQVRYTLPYTSGVFYCNQPLEITDEEFYEYKKWALIRDH